MTKVTLRKSELTNLIMEHVRNVLNEYGKFNRFGGGTAQRTGQEKGNLMIISSDTDTKKSSVTGKEKEYIKVGLGHVWKDKADELAAAINSAVPKQVMQAITTNSVERVVICVNIDMKKEVPNYIAKVCQAIKDLGQYTDKSVDNVCSQLYDQIDAVATQSDIQTAETNTNANWREMIQKLNDPEYRKRLLRYQLYNEAGRTYGHMLSPLNIKKVLDQFPTASFVTDANTWRTLFHRQVKPNAHRIVIIAPPKKESPTREDLDKAAQKSGYPSFKEAMKQTKNSVQVKGAIEKIAAKDLTKKFYQKVVYDVSETIPPLNPKDDVWTNTAGYSDNITGVLNSVAQGMESNIATAKKQEDDKDSVDKNSPFWNQKRQVFERVCENRKIVTTGLDNLSDADYVIEAFYLLAMKEVPKYGFTRPNDFEAISSICAAWVAQTYQLKLTNHISGIFKKYNNQLTDGEVMAAKAIVDSLYKLLSKKPQQK